MRNRSVDVLEGVGAAKVGPPAFCPHAHVLRMSSRENALETGRGSDFTGNASEEDPIRRNGPDQDW
jgi:hypothetical protein